MDFSFAKTLRNLREERGLSQTQLGRLMFVSNSTITRWENGSRLPDAAMIARLAKVLQVDVDTLLTAATGNDEDLNVILVDDEKISLIGGLLILEEALPQASIAGFMKPSEALSFARSSRVSLAFLDIELGKENGLDLCRRLVEIHPRTNIVFLTAYADYSLDAWKTEASGFLLKPLTTERVKEQLARLRYPLRSAEDADFPGGVDKTVFT